MGKDKKIIKLEPTEEMKGVIAHYHDKVRTEDANVGDYIEEKSILFGINRNIQRDLPSIIDGLTPVERRMLYTMFYHGYTPNSNPVKVATIVGQCIELVYPHGDGPLNSTNARIGREWNMMIPYVKGEGNFGNMYDKKEASMRYRKAKLSKYAYECFFSETSAKGYKNFDMKDNYNFSDFEPIWLPSKYPNILAQWNIGIGVGASSTLGAFNFEELCKAAIKLIDDPKAKINIYPDTPLKLYVTNKDKLEGCFDKNNFTLNTIVPYEIVHKKGSNKENLIYIVFKSVAINASLESIEEEIKKLKQEDSKKGSRNLKGVVDMRVDVSSDSGKDLNFYIQVEKGYNPDEIAQKILSLTNFSSSIHVAYNVIKGYQVIKSTPRALLLEWIDNRIDQKFRTIQREIYNHMYDVYITSGLIKVYSKKGGIDKLLDIVRNLKGKGGKKATEEEIVEEIMKVFELFPKQAQFIVNTKISKLSSLSVDELKNDHEVAKEKYQKALDSCNIDNIKAIIKEELKEGAKMFGSPRNLLFKNPVNNIESRSYHVFYNREGFYSSNEFSMKKPEIDKSFTHIEVTSDLEYMIFYSNGSVSVVNGGAFEMGEIPGSKEAILTKQSSRFKVEGIVKVIPIMDNIHELLLVTKTGYCKRIETSELMGKLAFTSISLDSGNELVDVLPVGDNTKDLVCCLFDRESSAIITKLENVPVMKRSAKGKMIYRNKSIDIHGASIISSNSEYVLLVGDNGTFKAVTRSHLKFDTFASIQLPDRRIRTVVGLNGSDKLILFSTIKREEIPYRLEKGKIVFIVDKEEVTLKHTSTLGTGTKILKKGKTDYYEVK